ncbi:cytochrome P450 monooxygenase [Aspergillus luchuensis]|uniref:Cytochrome P450 monooxygenase n=1 Tax=Aspergillus kawachii TaxID=1069201 RepID=A0A146F374_ASPKA|nr:cytochrome P450 monooxygenase [Aspergillus luchuensis]
MVLTGRLMFTFKELHDTYGPVVRIGPSELSFATNSAFDTIYGPHGDNNFSLYGSRKGLLGSLGGMADSLGNSTEKDNRRKLRPLVATSLNELLAAKGEEYCHLAMAEQLAFHHVGQTEAAPVSLSTLNNRYLWQFASMAAFGNRGDEAEREYGRPSASSSDGPSIQAKSNTTRMNLHSRITFTVGSGKQLRGPCSRFLIPYCRSIVLFSGEHRSQASRE